MISDSIKKLQEKTNLSHKEITEIMTEILSGKTAEQENYDFLSGLTEKGETDEELLGMLEKMNEFSLKITPENEGRIIDVCGTGGDKLQTFNISTTASFVIAASGGIVAKHGNRSNSGIFGSADIFEYFGYDLMQEPDSIKKVLKKFNICFMFAQKFHPAMKHIASARKKLQKRTAFNILGPLTNPAGVKNQLIGVSSDDLLERLPKILQKNGAEYIMTVKSENGMDEFSTSANNKVCFLKNGKILTNIVNPEMVGLHKSPIKDIQINTKEEAIKSFVDVLNGTANQAMIETTALNAAGGLIVNGITSSFDEGVELALSSINDGKAFKLFTEFIKNTGDQTRIKEVLES